MVFSYPPPLGAQANFSAESRPGGGPVGDRGCGCVPARSHRWWRALFLLCVCVCGICFEPPARAITLNITYDASVTNGTPFTSQIKVALGTITNTFHVLFTNSSTVNITCYWGNAGPFVEDSIQVSASQFIEGGPFGYAQITNALRKARVTLNDTNAVASLPATSPIGTNQWWLPRAQAKALNLGTNASNQVFFSNRNDAINDGSITFGTDVLFDFSPTNRAATGKFDFIAVAEHEISEVMGRTYELDQYASGIFIPYDLFRFTNSGARSLVLGADNAYFSVNNGTNNLKMFYEGYDSDPYLDACDWQPTGLADAFDVYGAFGQILPLSELDMIAMDIMGYHSPAIPAPHLKGFQTNGTFQLSFTNVSSVPFSVFASANVTLNITNWSYLGLPFESTTGHYQFVGAPVATQSPLFFRVSFP
jgi:hypothetical protein